MTKSRTRNQVVEIVCRGQDGVETTHGAASSPPGLHCPPLARSYAIHIVC